MLFQSHIVDVMHCSSQHLKSSQHGKVKELKLIQIELRVILSTEKCHSQSSIIWHTDTTFILYRRMDV